MKRRLLSLVNLLLLLSFLVSCQGSPRTSAAEAPVINPPITIPEEIDSYPAISARNAAVEEDYVPIAETGNLRLYLKEATSAVLVEDLRSGAVWRSSPANLQEGKGTTGIWKKVIELPVQMGYVDANRD